MVVLLSPCTLLGLVSFGHKYGLRAPYFIYFSGGACPVEQIGGGIGAPPPNFKYLPSPLNSPSTRIVTVIINFLQTCSRYTSHDYYLRAAFRASNCAATIQGHMTRKYQKILNQIIRVPIYWYMWKQCASGTPPFLHAPNTSLNYRPTTKLLYCTRQYSHQQKPILYELQQCKNLYIHIMYMRINNYLPLHGC